MEKPWTTLAAGAVKVAVRRDPSAADLPFPTYMTEGAAGADLHAAVTEPLILKMGDIVRIPDSLPPSPKTASFSESPVLIKKAGCAEAHPAHPD